MIRSVIFSAGIIVLFVNTCMAQEQGRPAWARFAKSETRLSPQTFASDLPAATAFVAADGKVQAIPADMVGDISGSSSITTAPGCSSVTEIRPAELRKMAAGIAADEGISADLVAAILRIEMRSGADKRDSVTGVARLTSGSRAGNEDCLPAVTLRAGIRRLKDLSSRYPEKMHLLGAYHAGEDTLLASSGVPASQDTLRFVAEVMNELFGGITPKLERRLPASARRIARAESAAHSGPSPSRATGDPRWASGFVLNLE